MIQIHLKKRIESINKEPSNPSEINNPSTMNDPYAPPLSSEQIRAAAKDKIVTYPEITRTDADPPISNQGYTNISFLLFKEPRKLKTGKPVYGFFKNRGNWATPDLARSEAAKIIREVDSKFQIRIGPVGRWLPIADEDRLCEDLLDVKTEDQDIQLRDQAVKEKEAEQRRIMREIKEREEECKKTDIYDDPTSLTYYSMRRVTEMKLTEELDNMRRKIENTLKIRNKVWKELRALEYDHKDYVNEWLERYNEERRKGGIPDFKPSERQFDDYEKTTLHNIVDESKEDIVVTVNVERVLRK